MEEIDGTLAESFRQMSDDELLIRWSSGYLTDAARQVAQLEFSSRQMKVPPYIEKDPGAAPVASKDNRYSFDPTVRPIEAYDPSVLVEIAATENTGEFEALAGRLESEGIPYRISRNLPMHARDVSILERLIVPPEFEEQAREILSLFEAGAFALKDNEDPT
jgi:hypothetical protein